MLKRLIKTPSRFRSEGPIEGIILRIDEKSSDERESLCIMWLEERAKVARPDFVAGCVEGYWMMRTVEKQAADYEFANEDIDQW